MASYTLNCSARGSLVNFSRTACASALMQEERMLGDGCWQGFAGGRKWGPCGGVILPCGGCRRPCGGLCEGQRGCQEGSGALTPLVRRAQLRSARRAAEGRAPSLRQD